MKKGFLLSFLLSFFFYTSNAQLLGYLDLPVVGEQWVEYKDTIGANINITAAGPGQSWNYQNSFTVHQTNNIVFQNPNTVPSAIGSLFPQATLVTSGPNPGDYTFYTSNFNGLYVDGYYYDAGFDFFGQTVHDMNYSNDILNLPIPFEFGNVVQNNAIFAFTYPDPNFLPDAIIRVTKSIFQDIEIDAQGSLITPFASYSSTIRAKILSTKNVLVEVDSFGLGNFTYVNDFPEPTTVQYQWFKNGPNYLVMSVQLDEFNNVSNAQYYNAPGVVGLADTEQALVFDIYPNPLNTNDKLYISIKNQSDDQNEIFMYDVSGREVLSTTTNNSLIELDTHQLNSGMYYVKINNQKQSYLQKVIINKQ